MFPFPKVSPDNREAEMKPAASSPTYTALMFVAILFVFMD
jgi:hypothetical protein